MNKENSNHFTETLVPANMQQLNSQMQNDKKLYELLHAKNLEVYKHLLNEVFPDSNEACLLNVIAGSIGQKFTSYFSVQKNSNKIMGFVTYQVSDDKRCVKNLKTFSFNLKEGNKTLVRNLLDLLNSLLQKYESVSWKVAAENPVVMQYNVALKHFKKKNCKVQYEILELNDKKLISYRVWS